MPPRWLKFLPPTLQRQLASPMAQKLVGNTGWLFADKLLKAVGELTVGIWLARYLGPDQFGTLSFAIAFVALFTPFYTLGLDKIVVRDIVQHPEQARETLGSALGLRLAAGVVIAAGVTGLAVVLRPSEPLLQGLIGLMAFGMVFQASDVVTFWFQSQIQARRDVVARSSAYGLTTLARIGCIIARAPLSVIGLTYVFEPMARAFGLTVIYWKVEGFKQKWNFKVKQALKLLKQSWPLIFSSIAIMVYMRIDQVMLGQIATNESVGIYSAAVKISEGWYFIPVTIASSIFPAIVQLKGVDETSYHKQLKNLLKLIVAISYSIILVLVLFSRPIIVTLFGIDYLESSTVLMIHAWAGVFASLGTVRGLWMITENHLNLTLAFTFFGALLNIVLNYLLIPDFLAIGASIATLISYFFASYAFGFFVPSTQKITFDMTKAIFMR